MPSPSLRIAILGAGLGGLCLANKLQALGCTVSIFERDAALDSRAQGYRIRINESGRAALAYCLGSAASSALCNARARSTALRSYDFRLQSLAQHLPAWSDRLVEDELEQDWKMDRQAMRLAMLTGLEPLVHWGAQLNHVHCDASAVTLSFASGTHHQCDVLVAADGVNSWLAQHYLAIAGAQDTGAVCLYGKVALAQAHAAQLAAPLLQATHAIFAPQLALIIDPMQFDGRTDGSHAHDYLYWAMIGQRQRLGLTAGSLPAPNSAALARCIDFATADWAPPLRALFAATPSTTQSLMAVRQSPWVAEWPTGRITALGDAVHAMSPASGLGCNTALRDAELLCRQLAAVMAGTLPLQQAIGQYEQALRQHGNAAQMAVNWRCPLRTGPLEARLRPGYRASRRCAALAHHAHFFAP